MKVNIGRSEHEKYCKKILGLAKASIEAFVFDIDGTIKSSSEPDCLPLELVKRVINAGKLVGIVTASGVSALAGLAESLIKLSVENNLSAPIYFGIANGMALYKLDGKGREELYSLPLDADETNGIVQAWKLVVKKNGIKRADLAEKGLRVFDEFLKRDWGDYISNDLLKLSKKFNGRCFVESLKVTLVMPKSEVVPGDKFVVMMQTEIDRLLGKGKYIIDMGDAVFAHATKRPKMSPKLFALKRIKKELDLKDEQILSFGDMPLANDKGLLIDSQLPYTFTNKVIEGKALTEPPFLLPGSLRFPVASVYEAVEYLLV